MPLSIVVFIAYIVPLDNMFVFVKNVDEILVWQILNLPFFKTVKLPDLDNWDSSQVRSHDAVMTSSMIM